MAFEQKDNATVAFQAFLKALKAPITAATIHQTFSRHPHYPSLLAVTDCLHEWHIDHATARLQPEQLTDLTTPFFTQVDQDGGLFTVVSSVSEAGVRWLHTQRGWQQDTIADFKATWVPVVLLAEVSATSGEPDFQRNHRQERLTTARTPFVWAALLLGVLCAGLLVAKPLTQGLDWPWYGFLLTKLMGIGVSAYLLGHTINRSGWSSPLCQFHEQVDCDAVLSSRAATLWGWLSWSEIGFIYFSGGALALFLAPESNLVKTVLWGLGLLALPYPLFSVYYQARVVKKWCTLCLVVQALLILDGFLLASIVPVPTWDLMGFAALGLAFSLPTVGWTLVKLLLQGHSEQPALQRELTRLRANPLLFASLLRNQKALPPLPDELQPIRMGNPQATCSITLVLNPYCAPCADTFADMKRLLGIHPFINCRLLFATTPDENDPRGQFIRRLYTIRADERVAALQQWYDQTTNDFPAWSQVFPTAESEPYARYQVHLQSQWCATAGLKSTPAILVDGYLLPAAYQLRDIPYLLKYGPATQPATKQPALVPLESNYQA